MISIEVVVVVSVDGTDVVDRSVGDEGVVDGVVVVIVVVFVSVAVVPVVIVSVGSVNVVVPVDVVVTVDDEVATDR